MLIYEHLFFLASPFTSESTQAFIDKICGFAEANDLSSEAYRSSLPKYSVWEVRKHLNEVMQFLYRQLGMESDVNAVITNGRNKVLTSSAYEDHLIIPSYSVPPSKRDERKDDFSSSDIWGIYFSLPARLLFQSGEKDHESPRGLQLILGTKSAPHLVDPLVMANMGFWQMKVSSATCASRNSELYVLKEDGDASQGKSLSKRITMNDLWGKVVHLEVLKKKGKEQEKLLVSADDDRQSQETKISVLC
ncbi:hypothetical protein LWI28_024767 [Acer negundo]|uniref:Uncharacterized protein n=1 Tax=Acer negundo TaxID=4023 RepID=A0AAD5NKL7_ACENE|nr:hypothetical protein LWI28_024767 [Acer negundo]